MLARALARPTPSQLAVPRLRSMAQHVTNGAGGTNGTSGAVLAAADLAQTTTSPAPPSSSSGVSLSALAKSSTFTTHLPADARYPTPASSHAADRSALGPAAVKNALYTWVRPEPKRNPELLAVSAAALRDAGVAASEAETQGFLDLVSGNADYAAAAAGQGGPYPWAQCYGGWQFGNWAGQLGDGRAISLFEATDAATQVRWEWQLKGAGRTPYSRFADGKAVLRSSLREFVASEALAALGVPTTRALSLVLAPEDRAARERLEPCAVVCRLAPTWVRVGTFDLLRARGDRANLRRLADYVGAHVFGWDALPGGSFAADVEDEAKTKAETLAAASGGEPEARFEAERPLHLNRYAQLFRHVCAANARTVAAWQAYGFTNGVLNTDNTSVAGVSLDFGPFAFLDNFDPGYTPNHDDGSLRYAYRSQPSAIWWNLVRLGESLGELMGAGPRVDDAQFVDQGVAEDWAPELVARAERAIQAAGAEFQREFLREYKRLMGRRLGLRSQQDSDFKDLFSELLDAMEALELDFSRFFRTLSGLPLADLADDAARADAAARFFHAEGMSALGQTDGAARERVAAWLGRWRTRVLQDWGDAADAERMAAMKAVNPNFVARGWVLDEVIRRVEKEGDRQVLGELMAMVLDPFADSWAGGPDEERWCGDVPRALRGGMCSCSS